MSSVQHLLHLLHSSIYMNPTLRQRVAGTDPADVG